MQRTIKLLVAISLAVLPAAASEKPNIVVVLVDDMGFSSLGCYGGEIKTPNLDALASAGMRFSHFYNNAKCVPSRISIMSGQYEGRAGGRKFSNSVTMGEALKPAGYRTIAVGKWHLDEEKGPTHYGFDRCFVNLGGFSSYFLGNEDYYKNGQPFTEFPDDFYTTDAFTDFSVDMIAESLTEDDSRPFLLYLAYNAPHGPLQCKKEDYAKYRDTYKIGWDEIRKNRYERQVEMGLIGPEWKLSERPDFIPAWDSLVAEERAVQAEGMATYAAVVDNIDQNIGRLVTYLKSVGKWENTLFLFLSDNGASPFVNPKFRNREPWAPDNHINVGVAWANADNTPFRWFKQNQHEGGISAPFIAHYPALSSLKKEAINDEPIHIMDVLPTLLEITGASYPTTFPGRDVRPPSGRSFLPLLKGEDIEIHREVFFHYSNNRALRSGDWKLVSARSGPWELYNLKEDRTELTNLADEYPERVTAMKARWHEMSNTETKTSGKHTKPVNDKILDWGLDQRDGVKSDPRQRVAGEYYKMSTKKKRKKK